MLEVVEQEQYLPMVQILLLLVQRSVSSLGHT
jgi:hypothetical protein